MRHTKYFFPFEDILCMYVFFLQRRELSPCHIISAVYRPIQHAGHYLYNTRTGFGWRSGKKKKQWLDGKKTRRTGAWLWPSIVYYGHLFAHKRLFLSFYFLICTATAAAIFTFHFYWQPQASAVKYLAKKETARLPKGFYVSAPAWLSFN